MVAVGKEVVRSPHPAALHPPQGCLCLLALPISAGRLGLGLGCSLDMVGLSQLMAGGKSHWGVSDTHALLNPLLLALSGCPGLCRLSPCRREKKCLVSPGVWGVSGRVTLRALHGLVIPTHRAWAGSPHLPLEAAGADPVPLPECPACTEAGGELN